MASGEQFCLVESRGLYGMPVTMLHGDRAGASNRRLGRVWID